MNPHSPGSAARSSKHTRGAALMVQATGPHPSKGLKASNLFEDKVAAGVLATLPPPPAWAF